MDVNDSQSSNQEFVEGMNQKAETRKLVPNKYQHQIHELTLKLEELSVQMNIKECENKLFKDNINTTQVQLQEKSNTINELNTIITTLKEEKETKEKELANELSTANNKLANLQIRYNNLVNEHNSVIHMQSLTVSDSSVIQTKCDELETKYNNVLKLYNDKVQESNNITAKFNKSQTELKLKQTSLQQIEDSVSVIKQELETTMNNNVILAKEIVEKDNYLRQLINEISDLKKQLEDSNVVTVNSIESEPVSNSAQSESSVPTPIESYVRGYKRNNIRTRRR
jgi:chromosome segregation ATPase